jgi:hypothetical protein
VIVAALSLVVGLLFVKDTRHVDIGSDTLGRG